MTKLYPGSDLDRLRIDRRQFLKQSSAGMIGSLALTSLLARDAAATGQHVPGPHFAPRARQVICLFQNGGPSQMDLFDPKPALSDANGKPYPGSRKVETLSPSASGNLLGSPFRFQPAGQAGILLSELIPEMAGIADEITLIRSMHTESVCHETALRIAHSGHPIATDRPSFGAWMVYGLGWLTDELPSFVVLPDPAGLPINGTLNWSAGWLPARYQGTSFNAGDLKSEPVLNLKPPDGQSVAARSRQLRLVAELNRGQAERYPENSELQARIQNFETAAKMQAAVPQVVDLSRETEATHRMYGLHESATQPYGLRCLLARRLIEAGVRFVGVYLQGQPWDTHSENAAGTRKAAAAVDQSSAALVRDLKQRGLLESTIVVWMGEFGRTPVSQGANGRDHSRRGFSLWLAGGGLRRGYVHGTTDEFGYEAQDDPVSVHDLHATLLHQLGFDHRRLAVDHAGRLETLTDADLTKAQVIPQLLS